MADLEQQEVNAMVALGRDYGGQIIQDALEGASTVEEMNRKIFIIRVAAIHVLAIELENDKYQNEATDEEILLQVLKELRAECIFIGEAFKETTSKKTGPPAPVYPIRG